MILFGRRNWHGESGRNYRFRITLTDKGLPEGGGVYIFVRRRFVFFLKALYVGKAADFKNRLIGHERWHDAWHKCGATERHILCIESREDQARFEEDLIRALKPPMNTVHVPSGRKDAPNDKKLAKNWQPRKKAFFGLFG